MPQYTHTQAIAKISYLRGARDILEPEARIGDAGARRQLEDILAQLDWFALNMEGAYLEAMNAVDPIPDLDALLKRPA